ncbi:MAG: 1-acyl-sn-glycerol-3-phosphate acyltransferase [Steroidobacteraceae bacterium]
MATSSTPSRSDATASLPPPQQQQPTQHLQPTQPQRRRRWALWLLALAGWRTAYTQPPGPKGVIMVYPHTSNWDFVVGVLYKLGHRLPARFLGKDSLFRGLMGLIMRALGGIAIDRSRHHGVIAALLAEYERRESMWLAIAPEGTRSWVPHLKSGFYHLCVEGRLPCALGFIDYGTKTVGIERYVYFTGDVEKDLQMLREYYAAKRGRRQELAGAIQFKDAR